MEIASFQSGEVRLHAGTSLVPAMAAPVASIFCWGTAAATKTVAGTAAEAAGGEAAPSAVASVAVSIIVVGTATHIA
jgi:hypothetical protein